MWRFVIQLKNVTMFFRVVLYVLIVLKGIDTAVEEFVQDPSVSDRVCTGSDVLFTEKPVSRINCAVLCTNANCSGFAYRGLDGKCVGCRGNATGMTQQESDMKYMYNEQMNGRLSALADTTTSVATTTSAPTWSTAATTTFMSSATTAISLATTESVTHAPSTTSALITSSAGSVSTSGPGSTTLSTGMDWGSGCDDDQHLCAGDHLCMAGICVCQAGYSFNFTSNTCVNGCVTYGTSFQMYQDHELETGSYYKESDMFLQDCMQMCLDYSLCKSFDFDSRRDQCSLYDRTALDNPDNFEPESGVDHYNRDC